MDDEPIWATDRIVALTPVFAITIPETTNEFAIKVIMEYLVKISKKALILELKRRYLKITVLTPNTAYPSRKIRRICCVTKSYAKELFMPFKDPEREFRSSRKHFKTLSLHESRSPDFDQFSDQEEYSKEEVAEKMVETIEQYMSKTRADYRSRIAMPEIDEKITFK
nr:hypothetical protein [Tanacetum cinerariifolium]